jgi:hypothetical protein
VIDRARVGEAVAALHDAFQAELEVSADGAVGV